MSMRRVTLPLLLAVAVAGAGCVFTDGEQETVTPESCFRNDTPTGPDDPCLDATNQTGDPFRNPGGDTGPSTLLP